MTYENWKRAQRVCVIGAGTMGSGIAAHLANIGFEVTLLDLTAESAEAGLERARQNRPPHFFVESTSENIRLGGIEGDLEWAGEADWVCEAIIENLEAKRELFTKLDSMIQPDSMITTNTSGLEIRLLAEGRSASFRERFMGTHFFNPPRYLKLLELIPTGDTAPKALKQMAQFLEDRVARRVVLAKDTPGFIANRFGMWSMYSAVHATERLHLSIEQADLITGPFLGRPRSGSFRLNDMVGLDIMENIAQNLIGRCPSDPHIATLATPTSMKELIEKGWIGDKAGQGYYKKEGKELVALDMQTMAYRMRQEVGFPSLVELSQLPLGERIGRALAGRDEVGEFLRLHLVPILRYANYLKEEISHNVLDFDRVMMWGFGWQMGPFAMIDAIGPEKAGLDEKPYYEKSSMRSFEGPYISIPKQAEYKPLSEYKVLESHEQFNVRDLGDGVTGICLTTKMGTVNKPMVQGLTKLIQDGAFKRFVLTSEARSFSAGFDLSFFADLIAAENLDAIDLALQELQTLAGKLSEKPGVAAIFGHCFGAGFELASRCSAIVANSEAQIGLPEAKVGLIPAGGGTAVIRVRHQHLGPKPLCEAASRLLSGTVSTNADEARALGYLRPTDITCYHPDRLIYDAKRVAASIETRPEEPLVSMGGPLAGMIDDNLAQRKRAGEITEFDEQIGLKIKTVFVKSSSFQNALDRERQMFIELCTKSLSLLRIKHMLETGKPLRN